MIDDRPPIKGCKVCNKPIVMMVQKGTGFCAQACQRAWVVVVASGYSPAKRHGKHEKTS